LHTTVTVAPDTAAPRRVTVPVMIVCGELPPANAAEGRSMIVASACRMAS
jgi:hypothetical protein